MLNHPRFACTTKDYDSLYARYLQNPEKLLSMANFNNQHRLLDLCGGTGVIVTEALRLGTSPKNITLIDLNPRCQHSSIRQLRGGAVINLQQLIKEGCRFETIICRQAIAYLDLENTAGKELAELIALLIPSDCYFVFNSFIRPRFHAKTYRYQGQRFIELAGHFKRRVFRLQVNFKVGMDLTLSKWHKEERIFELFNPWFYIETSWSQNAIYWICKRRKKEVKT